MSPDLREVPLPHDRMRKFVREGLHIVHDVDTIPHDQIAEKHEITNPDDAGFINDFGDEISVGGESFHLELTRDERARRETLEIVSDITGKLAVDYESE